MTPDEAARAATDMIGAWCAANPGPALQPAGSRWFDPHAEPIKVTYMTDAPIRRSIHDAYVRSVPGSIVERERVAFRWPWGAYWLYVCAGVHPEDRDTVRDRYETALGWARARGSASDMRVLETFTDAITETYGGFPGDWPILRRPSNNPEQSREQH